MRKYEVTHYQINLNTIDVNHITDTVVYADMMHVSENGTLMFFERLEDDNSMRAIKTWHADFWIFSEEIEDDVISADEYANAGVL